MGQSSAIFRLQDLIAPPVASFLQLSDPNNPGQVLPGGPVDAAISWAKGQTGAGGGPFGLDDARKVTASIVRQTNARLLMWYALYAYMVACVTRVPDFWLQTLLSLFSRDKGAMLLLPLFTPGAAPYGAFTLVPPEVKELAAKQASWQLSRAVIGQSCRRMRPLWAASKMASPRELTAIFL